MTDYRTLTLKDGSSVAIAGTITVRSQFAVVALPGWKGSDLGLRYVLQPSVAQGSSVVIVNFPGAGISDTGSFSGATLLDFAILVEEVIASISCGKRVVLIGHSFGATVAALVAARKTVDLVSLILISPQVYPRRIVLHRSAFARSNIIGKTAQNLSGAVLCSRGTAFLSNICLSRRGWHGIRDVIRKSKDEGKLIPDRGAMLNQFRIAARHGCAEFGPAIAIPTSIIAGTRDQFCTPDSLRNFSRSIPQSQLSFIGGAGHLAHHEDTEIVGCLIARQIRRAGSVQE